jgi:hypothetical protein
MGAFSFISQGWGGSPSPRIKLKISPMAFCGALKRLRSRRMADEQKKEFPMPEICPQEEAQQIVFLAAWVSFESRFFAMLTEAGCTSREAQVCMTMEAV